MSEFVGVIQVAILMHIEWCTKSPAIILCAFVASVL